MNDEIQIEKAESAARMLEGMNRTYINELKRAQIEHEVNNAMIKVDVRNLELKPFGDGQEIM